MKVRVIQRAVSAGLSEFSISIVTLLVTWIQPDGRTLTSARKKRARMCAPDLHRRHEAHRLEAVVDAHAGAFERRHGFEGQGRQQRQRQEAMRDGAAERRFGGSARRIDMDELVVVGRVRELVDHLLRDDAPGRHADFLADGGQQLAPALIGFKRRASIRTSSLLEQRHSVLHRLAAVDRQDGAGDIAAGPAAQIKRRAGDVIRDADPADRDTRPDMFFACSSVAVANAVIRLWNGPGANALTVMRRLANSIASVRVR